MGREIRRVPMGWNHPTRVNPRDGRLAFVPLYDETIAEAMTKYAANPGDWDDQPPDPEAYRPEWPSDAVMGMAVYETVSEGTPVTPTFATPEELVEYLVANGDYWDQSRRQDRDRMRAFGLNPIPSDPWRREAAEAFVKRGWAPSFVASAATGLLSGASDADKIEAMR